MQAIIPPVSKELLKAELTPERRLRSTNKAGNEIYIITYQQAPNVMREIGRLREIAFRAAGGGTGQSLDWDEFDTCEHPYYQLIVWDPEEELILGGYRFLPGCEMQFHADGQPHLATGHMFHFSEKFIKDYLPRTVELGRSFVTLEYQSTRALTKGLFALDNLWDGLGALTVDYPEIKYLFGKVTMYPTYDSECRDMLLHFMHKHFPDTDALVQPITPLRTGTDLSHLDAIITGHDFKTDYKALNTFIREHGINIPPLINAYMSLSPSMRMCGTAINYEFGDVEETAILLTLSDIYEVKKNRHIDTYHPNHSNPPA